MATMTVKSTYSMDVETVRTLERLAKEWKVSKSEALRRAIRHAAEQHPVGDDALSALDELQGSLGLSEDEIRRWETSARALRRESSRRLEGHKE
jgi:Arc/MetJ-type ribon-helix-helix transcriptional regulator